MFSPPFSVIIPVCNEQRLIQGVLEEINATLYNYNHEVVVVDDGSSDRTVEIVAKCLTGNQKLVILDKNYGQSTAILAGIDSSAHDWIVILDGDGQLVVKDIIRAYECFLEQPDGIVQGFRVNRQDTPSKRFLSRGANVLMRKLLRTEILDAGCPTKIFDKSILNRMPIFDGFHRLFSVVGQLSGVKIKQISVNHRPRKYGVSKYGMNRIGIVLVHIVILKFKIIKSGNRLPYRIKGILTVA